LVNHSWLSYAAAGEIAWDQKIMASRFLLVVAQVKFCEAALRHTRRKSQGFEYVELDDHGAAPRCAAKPVAYVPIVEDSEVPRYRQTPFAALPSMRNLAAEAIR